MASFVVTYDAHKVRNYNELYEAMKQNDGVRLAESVWGVELNNTVSEVRDWARGLLDDDDTIVVIQLKPKLSWATRKASKEANDWLKEHSA